jgi:hypothetical protein
MLMPLSYVCTFIDVDPDEQLEIDAHDAQEAAVRAAGWLEEQFDDYSVLKGEQALRIRVCGAEGVSAWEVLGAKGSYVAQAIEGYGSPFRSEQARKRLMHWREYAATKVGNGIDYGFAVAAAGIGIVGLVSGMAIIWLGILNFEDPSTVKWQIGCIIAGSVLIGFAIVAMRAANEMIMAFSDRPPVQLVTRETARHMPSAEILVRASTMPPSQQAELLRAAQHGKETPAEELMRATTTTGQNGVGPKR